MNVPFIDLKAQYASIQDEVDHAIGKVMRCCEFTGGVFVREFEQAFAAFCGCQYAVGVGSGTEALGLTLLAMGVGSGQEVITVPNTFLATAEAVNFCGAYPVFVDVDEKTGTMDPAKLEAFLKRHCQRAQVSDAMVNLSTGRHIKVVVPVHLHGLMADMDPIMEIAREYDLLVVEDASQAHGARYKGRAAGTVGHAGCFSFHPDRNLGACGRAGAVVTGEAELARIITRLRDHGRPRRSIHHMVGWNGRMDDLQAAILNVKLRYLEGWNAARRMVAEQYGRSFGELDNLVCPPDANGRGHAYNIYAVRVPDRAAFTDDLQRRGIATAVHYPVPIHRQEAYRLLPQQEEGFPTAEAWAAEVVSLPMYPELHFRQVAAIIEAVRASRTDAGRIYFEERQYAN